MAYVAWTLIVLAIRPHYPETPSNLVHGLRIAATLLMAMALARDEAMWALRGFLLISALNLLLVVVFYAVGGFHIWGPLRGVVMEAAPAPTEGPRSASRSCCEVIVPRSSGRGRLGWRGRYSAVPDRSLAPTRPVNFS